MLYGNIYIIFIFFSFYGLDNLLFSCYNQAMKNLNTVANIKIGNLSINILDLYSLFTSTMLSTYAHDHAFFEMHIILNGTAQMIINDTVYNVNKNEIIIIPKHLAHYSTFTSEDFQNCAFSFEFKCLDNPPRMRYEYKYFTELFRTDAVSILKIGAYERSLIATIFENIDHFSVYSINKINIEIANLFLEIGKKLNNREKKTRDDDLIIASDQFIVRKYKTEVFIQQSIDTETPIVLEDLAAHLFISPRQASRFLKETFGLTFKELLTRYRMIHASSLLESTDLSLEKIAMRVGYLSYNGFLSAYKKYYGTTPQHKKLNNKDKP